MRFNRLYFILIGIAFILSRCSREEKNLIIDVTNFNKCYHKDYKNTYAISFAVQNNTDSIIKFEIMSCSWESNFIFNIDSVSFIGGYCDSNFPIVVVLKPDEKVTYNGIVVFKQNNGNEIEFIRMGFVLIVGSEQADVDNFDKKLYNGRNNKKDIIWSGEIKLN